MAQTDCILVAEAVSHSYGSTTALHEVSFQVARGSILGLLGPNGSGKTTLFRILATLLPLQKGRVHICGFDLAGQAPKIRSRLGVTFQSAALDSRLTVAENLTCHGRIHGLSGTVLQHRLADLLDQFNISERRNSIVGDLSGGLRRRVELAKGFLHSPDLLLLDEPSTGLDPVARRQFWELIQHQRNRNGTTVIVTTHLMEEAESCDQLMLMHQGKVIRRGTPEDLQASVQGQRLTVRVRNSAKLQPQIETFLNAGARSTGDRLTFRVTNGAEDLRRIMDEFGSDVTSAEVARPTLEDVFTEATGALLSAPDPEVTP